MDSALESKVALITGASGGLGRVVVPAFEKAGYQVVQARRRGSGPGVERFEVTDPAAVKTAVDKIVADYGRIDVLLNLVGGWRPQPPVAETTDDEFEWMLNINLRSVFVMSRAVAPVMAKQGWGRIINIGAKPGERGSAGNAAYGASKAGVLVLTEAMAEELKGSGVTVNAIVPSIIDTPANRAAMPDADFAAWAPPAHLAAAMLFLCSPEAGSITGTRIHVLNRA